MDRVKIQLPYSDTALLTVEIDEKCLGEVVRPQPVEAPDDVDSLIARSLDAPLGMPRLEEAVHPGDRILILSDDNTRPTPAAAILPHVMNRLEKAGVRDHDVRILIASGTHRHMSPDEIRSKLGSEIVNRLPVSLHGYDDRSQQFFAGTSTQGIEVWLNKALLEADFILGIGNVVPHPHAGWAGGAKILYPGVAGADTVAAFHLVGTEDPTNYLGRDDAPARVSLEALADTAGLDCIINTVLTSEHRLYQLFCGQPRLAQQKAREAAREVYGVPVERRYDIVLSNSYPAYLEFWQAGKGIFSADLMLNPGGTIILTTPCPEGVGVTHPDQVEYLAMDPRELLTRTCAHEVADPIAAAVCAKVGHVLSRARVTVVSEGLMDSDVRAMGFTPSPNVQDAIAKALKEHGPGTSIAVISHGGETVPYVTEQSPSHG